MSDTKAAWDRVTKEAARLAPVHLRDLFARAPDRFERLSFQDEGLLIDLSKEKLDQDALSTLLDLARAVGLEEQRDRMLNGDRVNTTEGRAALHVALRGDADPEMEIDGVPVMATAHEARDQMLRFADDVRTGRRTASDGAAFSDVVNIGIGGSDLGPAMATDALAPYADGPGVHYVSNADGAHFADLSLRLDPARTLVIVASKTFSTPETMENAAAARRWLQAALGKAADTHLAAVSRNLEATAAFGVPPAQVFPMWDWVGGRYSVWSSIGLPLAIAIGPGRFKAFLDGAAAMDRHFRTAPAERNLPILMALQTVWRRNGLGLHAAAVLPYDQRLSRFPAWLQQLDMESLGKGVHTDGTPASQKTGMAVFGDPGTNAQHSFFQLLHQGTDVIPVDFLLAANPTEAPDGAHDLLAASALAQSAALAFGKSAEQVRGDLAAAGLGQHEIDRLTPHRTFPGDRPSTTILYERLDPYTLGRLLALFEHKTAALGFLWDINPFDQWGVELGKALTGDVREALNTGQFEGLDSSTAGLLGRLRAAW